MLKHFLYDITHFDSKFFDSMKYLLFRPGYLPEEYIKGRRARYLNPVKKYVFTSAVFFLLFFSVFVNTGAITTNLDQPLTRAERQEKIRLGEKELAKNPANSDWIRVLALLKDSSQVVTQADMIRIWDDFDFINISDRVYRNRAEYDSVQAALPPDERDDWFTRLIQKRNLELKKKYGTDPRTGTQKMSDAFLHKLPYLLFVSLPLFALLLKLLYIRRKDFYYADHGIFSIYHYIFSFFLLTAVFTLEKLEALTGQEWISWISLVLFFSGGIYLYMSMKSFYKQGHGKTLLKFVLLNIAGLLLLIFLFILFILLAIFEF